MITFMMACSSCGLESLWNEPDGIIMGKKEKRAATRIQVPLVGIMTFDTGGEGRKTISVVAKDVSVDGAYLWADAPRACPRVGDRMEISLRCASKLEQFQLSVEAVGTVVRVDQPQEGEHGFAVKFKRMPDLWPR